MGQIWDKERRIPRGRFVIPCLLHDTETGIVLKAVLLDLSADGCRVFTNDRRLSLTLDERLIGRRFRIEFDFYQLDTRGIIGTVLHVHPGEDPAHERQLGIQFTGIDPRVCREINHVITQRLGSDAP